jgi:hypothetical protein
VYIGPIVITKGRRLMDLIKKMDTMDKMMWAAIGLAVVYCGWAVYIMYINIKMGGM